jgi:hypothetical protein
MSPEHGYEQCANEDGLCRCGCGQTTTIAPVTDRRKGYQRGCPRLYVTGHNRKTTTVLYLVDAVGCWIWQGTRNRAGYGRVRVGKTMRFAHRVFYERAKGFVPPGHVLHHTCGRGHEGCMNPDHLIPVTPAEHARLRHGVKLDETRATAIRELVRAGGRPKTAIAREFGVSDVLVHYIASGRCWRNTPAP